MSSPIDFQPFADWLREYDGVEIALFITFIAVTIRLLWKWAKAALPQIETAIKFLRALGQLPEFMSSTTVLMGELKHEVLPNNGGSLRDETVTMGLRVEKIEAKLSKDHDRLSTVEGVLRYREENNLGIPPSSRVDTTTGTLPTFPPNREDTP